MLRELWTDEDGMAAVEYALMLMFVVVCSAAAWAGLGTGSCNSVTTSADAFPH